MASKPRKKPTKPKRLKRRLHHGETMLIGDKRVKIVMDRPYQAVVTITEAKGEE